MTLINTVSHDMCPLVRKVSTDPKLILSDMNCRYEIAIAGISGSSSMDGATLRELFRDVSYGRGE